MQSSCRYLDRSNYYTQGSAPVPFLFPDYHPKSLSIWFPDQMLVLGPSPSQGNDVINRNPDFSANRYR